MGCPDNSFKYLSSEANARETLVKEGAIDEYDKIIDKNKFKEQAKRFLDYVKKDFKLDVVSVITGRNMVAQFNRDVFSKVDKARGYDKINTANINAQLKGLDSKTKGLLSEEINQVKPGVEELFESNPELANTGTPEQYSQYLDTIFPDSKVKDIVYHGSKVSNLQILKSSVYYNGIYFTDNNQNALSHIERKTKLGENTNPTVYTVLINSTNPLQTSNKTYQELDELSKMTKGDETFGEAYDAIIANNVKEESNDGLQNRLEKQYVVFKSEQIYILGSKQDIEGFKTFMKNPIKSTVKNNMLSKVINIDNLANELGLEKNCN